MDERMLTALKAMARAYDELAGYTCSFCGGKEMFEDSFNFREASHIRNDCPVVVARAILREVGLPLKIYKAELERQCFDARRNEWIWKKCDDYTLDFSDEEAVRAISNLGKRRNVTVSLIELLPLEDIEKE
jgi:hypothetical protein